MLKVKRGFRSFLYKYTGLSISRKYSDLPFGNNQFNDILSTIRDYNFTLIFDVGANIGQSANEFKAAFPKSKIYCFEPVKSTFEILKENTQSKNTKHFHLALGNENKFVDIQIDKSGKKSDMNSLKNLHKADELELVNEQIELTTLDDFCVKNNINKIDYLKVDTEGFDLEVLKGSTNLIKEQKISFIEVEVGISPENKYHVEFNVIKEYLENYNYRVFGIYEQVQEWTTNKPILRRINTVFVANSVYE